MPRKLSDLAQLERWMQALVMHTDGVEPGLRNGAASHILPCTEENLGDVVLPSKQLNSVERLSIYGNMYFSRLIEILAEEFPTVQNLFGEELFGQVAKDYVTRHPSTHYSLSRLGRKFSAFLSNEAIDIPDSGFATSVATVERAMEDVFDAPHEEPIRFAELENIPLERWGDIHLRTIPALRLLRLDYPVNAYITAVREDRQADVPSAAPAYVAVYRHKFRVWRVDLDAQRFTLLLALQQGDTLGSALQLCASLPEADPESLANDVNGWFREWTAEGLFRCAQLDSSRLDATAGLSPQRDVHP